MAKAEASRSQAPAAILVLSAVMLLCRPMTSFVGGSAATEAAPGFRVASRRLNDRGRGCVVAAEAAESRGTSQSGPLICGKNVDVSKLAGAVANRIRESDVCDIECVGGVQIYSAVKAVNIGSSYLEETHPGQRLCIHHEWVTRQIREGVDTKVMRLHVKPVMPPVIKDEPEVILVKSNTNPGVVAGPISKAIEEQGFAALSCMGGVSMSKALNAIGRAESYLENRGALGDRVVGAVVRSEKFMGGDKELKRRMILTCMLQDKV